MEREVSARRQLGPMQGNSGHPVWFFVIFRVQMPRPDGFSLSKSHIRPPDLPSSDRPKENLSPYHRASHQRAPAGSFPCSRHHPHIVNPGSCVVFVFQMRTSKPRNLNLSDQSSVIMAAYVDHRGQSYYPTTSWRLKETIR